MKNKFKKIGNEQLKSMYKDRKQPNNLCRELVSCRFISNFKNIRKPGTYKCSDKRCKTCQIYLNETNKFSKSNVHVWKLRREIDCYSVNVMCNKKETYIGKTIRDNRKGFKVRINHYISDCKTGVSTCKFRRHVYD